MADEKPDDVQEELLPGAVNQSANAEELPDKPEEEPKKEEPKKEESKKEDTPASASAVSAISAMQSPKRDRVAHAPSQPGSKKGRNDRGVSLRDSMRKAMDKRLNPEDPYQPYRIKMRMTVLWSYLIAVLLFWIIYGLTKIPLKLQLEGFDPAKDVVLKLAGCDLEIATEGTAEAFLMYPMGANIVMIPSEDKNVMHITNEECAPGDCSGNCLLVINFGDAISELPYLEVEYPVEPKALGTKIGSVEGAKLNFGFNGIKIVGFHASVVLPNLDAQFVDFDLGDGTVILNGAILHRAHIKSQNQIVINTEESVYLKYRSPGEMLCISGAQGPKETWEEGNVTMISDTTISQGLSTEFCTTRQYMNVFQAWDSDGDGELNREEYIGGLMATGYLDGGSPTLADDQNAAYNAGFSFKDIGLVMKLDYDLFVRTVKENVGDYKIIKGCLRHHILFAGEVPIYTGTVSSSTAPDEDAQEPVTCGWSLHQCATGTGPNGTGAPPGQARNFPEDVKVCCENMMMTLSHIKIVAPSSMVYIKAKATVPGSNLDKPVEYYVLPPPEADANTAPVAEVAAFTPLGKWDQDIVSDDSEEAPPASPWRAPSIGFRPQDMDKLGDLSNDYAVGGAPDVLLLFKLTGLYVPAGKWMWASIPFYTYLEPATIELLTMGFLSPAYKKVKLTMAPGFCEGLDDPDEVVRLRATSDAIKGALQHPDELQLRGMISVKQTSRIRTWSVLPTGETPTDNGADVSLGSYAMLVATLVICWVLTFFMASPAWALGVYLWYAVLKKRTKALHTARALIAMEERAAKGVETSEAIEMKPVIIPPFAFLTDIIIQPLRMKFVHSLEKFINLSCHTPYKPVKKGKKSSQVMPNPADDLASVEPDPDADPEEENSGPPKMEYEMLLRNFKSPYARFCSKDNIKVRSVLKHEEFLKERFGITLHKMVRKELKGLKWKTEEEWAARREGTIKNGTCMICGEKDRKPVRKFANEAYERLASAAQPESKVGRVMCKSCRLEMDNDPVKLFIGCQLHMTFDYQADYILLKNFTKRFNSFLDEEVDLAGEVPSKAEFDQIGIRQEPVQTVRMLGIKLKTEEELKSLANFKPLKMWYYIQFATVTLHFLFLMAAPVFLIFIPLRFQGTYTDTTALEPDAQLVFGDIMAFPPNVDGQKLGTTFQVCMWTGVILYLIGILKLNLHYMEVNLLHPVRRLLRGFFYWYLAVVFYVTVFYVCEVFLWLMLALILKPNTFMPYATAAITLIAVSKLMWGKVNLVREAALKSLKRLVQTRMAMQLEASKHLIKASAGGGGAALAAGKPVKEEDPEPLSLTEVFEMFDSSGGGEVTFSEWQAMLTKMGMVIGEETAKELFAECDKGGTGTLNQKEFEDTYHKLEDMQVDGALAALHLTKNDIVIMVCGIVILMLLLFMFILLGVATLSGGSTLDAVVGSAMTAGSGVSTGGGGGAPADHDDEGSALDDADATAAE